MKDKIVFKLEILNHEDELIELFEGSWLEVKRKILMYENDINELTVSGLDESYLVSKRKKLIFYVTVGHFNRYAALYDSDLMSLMHYEDYGETYCY